MISSFILFLLSSVFDGFRFFQALYPDNETPSIFSTPLTEIRRSDISVVSETASYIVSVIFPECRWFFLIFQVRLVCREVLVLDVLSLWLHQMSNFLNL